MFLKDNFLKNITEYQMITDLIYEIFINNLKEVVLWIFSPTSLCLLLF